MKIISFALLAIATTASACSSSPSGDPASIRGVEFSVPSGWTKHDLSTPSRAIAEWRPPGDGNVRRESITVVRTERPGTAKAPPAAVAGLLAQAQRGLRGGPFSAPRAFSTKQGFVGFRTEGDFIPPGQATPYRRIHAAISDGTAIVHILYTAKDPEPDHVDVVIDSLISRRGV